MTNFQGGRIDRDNELKAFSRGMNRKLLTFTILIALAIPASASVTWFGPTDAPNSNANWPSGTAYTNNFGIAFKTGPSGDYTMDWLTIALNSSSQSGGTATLMVALHNTTNDTAYSAVAGSTSHAQDLLTLVIPETTATSFTLNLTAANIPNISSFAMAADTAYSVV